MNKIQKKYLHTSIMELMALLPKPASPDKWSVRVNDQPYAVCHTHNMALMLQQALQQHQPQDHITLQPVK